MSYVYWVYDKSCKDFLKDGYVGVTDYIENRIKYHMNINERIPKENELFYDILFEGSREECFLKEEEYRPNAGIGWNGAKGGAHGWVSEFTHSEKTKQKLKDAWTDERRESAAQPRPEHAEKLRGRKRPEHAEAISGKNNGMYGKTHSEEAKQKIREAHKGKEPWNKGMTITQKTTICPHCNKEGGLGNMKRYHFDNCKNKDL